MVGRRSDGKARRLSRAGALLAVVAGISWLAPGVPDRAQAQAPPAANAQEEYEHLTAEEVRLFTDYQATVQRAADLTAQVDRISATLAEVGIELNAAQGVLAAADAEVATATTKLDDTERALATARQRLRDKAVEAYIGGGSGSGGLAQADAVVRAESLNDINRALAYSDAVVTDQKTMVDRVVALRDESQKLREGAQRAQQEAAVRRDAVAERRAQIEASRDELAAVQEQVLAQAQAQQGMLADVSAKRQEYAQRVAAAKAASDSLAGVLRQRQEGQTLPPLGGGVFKMPVPGARISSTFGPRVDPVLGGTGRHDGIDFSAPTGTEIHAAADGTVVNAGEMGGYGNGTVIDHGNGLATLYGHQSRILVTPGQTVRTGDVIGLVGSTGKSTGPHLHFEVRQFGVPTDPVPYLST
jgi:murein DD-endopeptidase MepM/ murein hydrolase activator NlpD